MIRFHHHTLRDVHYCHVYSTETVAELLAWGTRQGIPAKWLQQNTGSLPHFDLWGRNLSKCGTGVDNNTVAADLCRWRRGR